MMTPGPPSDPRWRDEPVDRRLRGQALLTAAIGLLVLGLAVTDLVRGTIGPLGAALGFVGGAAVGVVAARVKRVTWDDDAQKVVGRVDRLGLAILVITLIAHLSRNWLLGHWVHGPLLTALGVWISVGGLLGRVLGTRRGVLAVLRTVGVKPLDGRPASE
jgi:hypothetical protein